MQNRRINGGDIEIQEATIEGEVVVPTGGYTEYAKIREALDASVNVGGIDIGDHYDSGTYIETILRDLIDPTLVPTLTPPSVSIQTQTPLLLESGTSIQSTINAVFDRGSISPAYGTSGYRSGPATGYRLNSGSESMTHSWTVNVSNSNKSFTVTASYSEGEQPKDEAGKDYNQPLPQGSVSNTISFSFVNALWANTNTIASIDKQPLVDKSTGHAIFTFPPQTEQNPEVFDIPGSWTVTAIEVYNQLSGKYEDCSREFSSSAVTHQDASGSDVAYTRYRDNRGYKSGSRTVRVSWN